MITKEQIIEIIQKHSRNMGDYLPDYKFEDVADEISRVSKEKVISTMTDEIHKEKKRVKTATSEELERIDSAIKLLDILIMKIRQK